MNGMKSSVCLKLAVKAVVISLAAPAIPVQAQDNHGASSVEQIIVTTPFAQTAAETALPVGSLSGEELREKLGNSLGDTLRNEIGISSASFGAGVGHPVIRGQSGNRVSVLSNGVGVTDASNQSPDHAEGVEAALADRLEIIRGPATLLYGSGAVGGVINVIDQRIPESLVATPELFIEQSYKTVSGENKTVARLDVASDSLALHLDAFRRDNNAVEIPGYAIDSHALEALDELLHQHEQTAEADSHLPDSNNSYGILLNSEGDSDGGSVGFSWIGERGFIGASVNKLENNYGLPPGIHSHGGDLAEPDPDAHTHGEVDFVRIDMDKTRYDIKGRLDFDGGYFDALDFSIGQTDYEHFEIEIFADGDREIGTRYSNEGVESRVTLTHSHQQSRSGVWGLQRTDTDFAAIGEEAFIPPSSVQSIGLFGVERFTRGRVTGELGLRHEWGDIEANSSCARSSNALSLSASVLYDVNADANLHFGLSRSERTATVEELYSNVDAASCQAYADFDRLTLHAASNLLEIGDAGLKAETANNIELGFRQFDGPVTGQISLYHNSIDDYIFLDITGEEYAEQPLARYRAEDAVFFGFEGELSFTLLDQPAANLEMTVFGDFVRAKFEAGGNVPRIPAAKFGTEFRYFGDAWSLHLHATRSLRQSDAGVYELPTAGYTQLSLYGDYHWELTGGHEFKVFLRADNLLDEEVRSHTSLLKNYAPEPARGFTLGLRFDY